MHLEARNRCRHFTLAVIHKHQMLHRGECREQRLNECVNRSVNEDHFIFCMVHDVGELLGEQTNVQRVQHAARTRSSEVQLQVALSVPRKCGHSAGCRNT